MSEDDLQAYFIEYTHESLDSLKGLVDRIDAEQADNQAVNEEMHAIAHNLKGMGASFDYPLMTSAGASLTAYLRGLGGDPADKRVIVAHHSAMQTILDQKMTGQGGEREQQMIRELKQMAGVEDL